MFTPNAQGGTIRRYRLMKELQIGLTVAMLPVVGIGVDDVFQICNRLQAHLEGGQDICHPGTFMPLAREAPRSFAPALTGGTRSYCRNGRPAAACGASRTMSRAGPSCDRASQTQPGYEAVDVGVRVPPFQRVLQRGRTSEH
ncbi:TPA: hypothetical protein QDC20_000382 [Burkholderia aenigmatica]|uniref:hypothetical protein n=1 Tax=Burkholderia sp. AU45251 TaxID=3059204 RepID=UPI0026559D06|nr:hypothetical protein [Burkholderia sp. AU45251]HDR9482243.1 hypothetical protein [Burkholderia aenigmatica]MDN7515120.1 hypothetical protein [Burkholderia sp. AU45251]HDR9514549.1 hypothetical protein [Burkholderia aenigmatica]HDR9590614.1 hypothetical protein [Burkholderia aenigmatica]HDR9599770.1 hypothetical protein [Burkholderia aenigmatica]